MSAVFSILFIPFDLTRDFQLLNRPRCSSTRVSTCMQDRVWCLSAEFVPFLRDTSTRKLADPLFFVSPSVALKEVEISGHIIPKGHDVLCLIGRVSTWTERGEKGVGSSAWEKEGVNEFRSVLCSRSLAASKADPYNHFTDLNVGWTAMGTSTQRWALLLFSPRRTSTDASPFFRFRRLDQALLSQQVREDATESV